MTLIRDRIRAYMEKHQLTRFMMAEALSMPVRQLDSYLYNGVTPPYVMNTVMDLLEQHPQVGAWIGARRTRERPRGKPFEPGHPWRFNDERRKQLLAEKRSRVA